MYTNTNKINWRWVSIGAVGFVLVAGIAGRADYEDAVLQEQAYCANVTLYHATAGEQGWPDYEGYYDTVCEQYSDDPEMFSNG